MCPIHWFKLPENDAWFEFCTKYWLLLSPTAFSSTFGARYWLLLLSLVRPLLLLLLKLWWLWLLPPTLWSCLQLLLLPAIPFWFAFWSITCCMLLPIATCEAVCTVAWLTLFFLDNLKSLLRHKLHILLHLMIWQLDLLQLLTELRLRQPPE